jgi:hypothetical protein
VKRFAPRAATLLGSLMLVTLPVGCASYLPASSRANACKGGLARPIAIDQAVHALRAEGFGVHRDRTTECSAQIAELLSNVFFGGPHENINQHDRIVRTQGSISCEVDKRPALAQRAHPTKVTTYVVRHAAVEAVMANLICTLQADSSTTRVARKVAMLRALDGLAQSMK